MFGLELLLCDDREIGEYTRDVLASGLVNMLSQQRIDAQQ
jgi:hypothetical protein